MATDYSLDLKASLDTAEVQEKLNDLSFKGKHATSDLEVAVKRLDNAVQDLTRTWEKQAEAARKAAENAEEAAKANGQGGGATTDEETSSFMKLGRGYFNAGRFKAMKQLVDKIDGADGQRSEFGTVLSEGLGGAATGAMIGKGNLAAIVAGAIYGVIDGFKKVEDAAKAAAKAMQDQADANRKEYKDFLTNEQRELGRERTLKMIDAGNLSNSALQEYIDKYATKKAEYAAKVDSGAADS